MSRAKKYYLAPLLLSGLIFISNFLNTTLFGQEIINFAVWFILSLFIFAIGWITNNTLGWVHGGKIVFSVIVAMAVISAMLVSFFSDYFLTENLLFENIILFTLRNIFLGSMAFFGMSVSELVNSQRSIENYKNQDNEKLIKEASKKAELMLKEAKLESDKIIFEATKKASAIIEQKNRLERKIKEFIDVEKEIIKKYESDKQ
ncbi:MAG: hypothetical protein H6610_00645 [Ignavibacteriales bacterium]|nr:hypothetical protein [Ignavibacteriales bacterium]MCB9217947.1 hypothetical protein [Ignavibacteriales bacterium]